MSGGASGRFYGAVGTGGSGTDPAEIAGVFQLQGAGTGPVAIGGVLLKRMKITAVIGLAHTNPLVMFY